MSKRWLRTIATAATTAALIGGTATIAAAYEVRSGDTLSEIAADHGTTWQDVYAANRDVIADPDLIYPGQSLVIDTGSGQAFSRNREKVPEVETQAASVVLPVSGYTLTATFGQSGSNWSSTHTGLDFAAPHGSAVSSIAAGTVTESGWSGAYGNRVVIDHGDYQTSYSHLSSISASGHVDAGQVIGAVGSTGNSTGPHLHLEIHVDGSAVDPYAFLNEKGLNP